MGATSQGQRWVLLLRGVNLGPRNKLAMADLRALLEDLGHSEVRTYLNSGNATFRSRRRGAAALAAEVEEALKARLGLTVRAVVLTEAQVSGALEALPDDLEGYVQVAVLIGESGRDGVRQLEEWEPEVVRRGPGVLYLAYPRVQGSKLTPALMERVLGVPTTARTPATLRKLLGT